MEAKKDESAEDATVLETRVGLVRKLFDYAIGAAVPLVLSLFIHVSDRLHNLERYRAVDEYRVEQLYDWRDNGDGRSLHQGVTSVKQRLADLTRKVDQCEFRLQVISKGSVHQHPSLSD